MPTDQDRGQVFAAIATIQLVLDQLSAPELRLAAATYALIGELARCPNIEEITDGVTVQLHTAVATEIERRAWEGAVPAPDPRPDDPPAGPNPGVVDE